MFQQNTDSSVEDEAENSFDLLFLKFLLIVTIYYVLHVQP
jgi:hypothetical protein